MVVDVLTGDAAPACGISQQGAPALLVAGMGVGTFWGLLAWPRTRRARVRLGGTVDSHCGAPTPAPLP